MILIVSHSQIFNVLTSKKKQKKKKKKTGLPLFLHVARFLQSFKRGIKSPPKTMLSLALITVVAVTIVNIYIYIYIYHALNNSFHVPVCR